MFTKEMLQKAREAKSEEELLSMAGEAGMELSHEQAERAFENLNGDLTEDELADVSNAGCCGDNAGCYDFYKNGETPYDSSV